MAPQARKKSRQGAERAGAAEAAVVEGVTITHPERVLDLEQGLTKLELARYYERVARRMLPHLADRPLSLVRCPMGTAKPCFYQKHAGFTVPKSVRRVWIRERTKTAEYLVVDDAPALVALVQAGVLEFHTWNSRASAIERPDRVVFDLDPGPDVTWERVARAARLVKEILERSRLRSFVKTTGGKGLHVVVPLAPVEGWEAALAFARAVAGEIEAQEPAAFTTEMSKAKRRGKILLDVMRNARGATSVAAFSTRARPGAPVSLPLDWDALDAPSTLTAPGVLERLPARRSDPWAGYALERQPLPAAVGPPRRGAVPASFPSSPGSGDGSGAARSSGECVKTAA
ncbi:MAG: non-homologous end-joining DNA ligase [Acidobacteriota bacterium]